MNKYDIIYQEVSEARITIEARDEEHLAEIMEDGNFDLKWQVVGFYSEIDSIEFEDNDE